MSPAAPLIVVGLVREARIARRWGRVVVGRAALSAAMADPPSALLSFGLCGALDPALRAGDVLIADAVVGAAGRIAADGAWTRSLRAALPDARRGAMSGGDVIVATPAAKAALARASGAAAVDMESHHVATAAQAHGLPFAVLRAVSDDARQALPRAAAAGFGSDGEPDVAAVIRALARAPWELPALIRVAIEAERAFKALERAAARLPALPRGAEGEDYSAGSR
jgi:hopanoid-associated phosphorylase